VESGDREREAARAGEEVIQGTEEETQVDRQVEAAAQGQHPRQEEDESPVPVTAGPCMFIRIWQFRVPPEKADEFRVVYRPDGDWATLFRRETAFLGTELLQSATHPNIFLTIDRWDTAEAWAAWGAEYAALDRRCQKLTVAEGGNRHFRGRPRRLAPDRPTDRQPTSDQEFRVEWSAGEVEERPKAPEE
jgi:heme-degrading monooxygenase HmoA